MQPHLSPIDHESRANHRATPRSSTENSPLLQYRFPRENHANHVATIIVVGCLLFLTLSAAFIGIYLLALQIRAENLLPPVDTPRYVRRVDWDKNGTVQKQVHVSSLTRLANPKADYVVIMQTDNGFCDDIPTCAELIEDMESQMPNHTLPYNYIINNRGDAYEYLGWKPSNYVPNRLSFVFAFIGNYTNIQPKRIQFIAPKSIINELITNERLVQNYTLLGKNLQDMKYVIENPTNIMLDLDHLMFKFLTVMYSDFPEAASHM